MSDIWQLMLLWLLLLLLAFILVLCAQTHVLGVGRK